VSQIVWSELCEIFELVIVWFQAELFPQLFIDCIEILDQ
jgi:hypothetical protein